MGPIDRSTRISYTHFSWQGLPLLGLVFSFKSIFPKEYLLLIVLLLSSSPVFHSFLKGSGGPLIPLSFRSLAQNL